MVINFHNTLERERGCYMRRAEHWRIEEKMAACMQVCEKMRAIKKLNMLIPIEPIVGKEVNAEDLIHKHCNSTEDQDQYRRVSGYKWYRAVNLVCSVHTDKAATVQCEHCVRNWLFGPASSSSVHCSKDCLIQSWDRHLELHSQATESSSAAEECISPINNRMLLSTWNCYTPTMDDLGKELILECAGKTLFHTQPVISFHEQGLPCMQGDPASPRGMIKVKSININAAHDQGFSTNPTFTVLTYNVLAQVYATPEKHCLCPPSALQWEHRKQKLITEIVEYDADIICLQEVQSNHFLEFFYPELRKRGYTGVYKAKQRGYYSPTIDGCATFYRVDQFNLLQAEWINLSSYATYLPGRFHKDNIALNVVLSFKNSGHPLCIANTHIHANPNNRDVKQWQVYYLLNRLESFVQAGAGTAPLPLVICGDFNSTPGSAVHSLVTQGYVNSAHTDLDYDPCGVLQPAEMFQHALPLVSAYSSYFKCDHVDQEEMVRKMDVDTREPRFTNFSCEFQGTLDYIFHTGSNLKVLSLLELIDKDEVKKGALPSATHPSDHIALAAKFSYISAPKSAL